MPRRFFLSLPFFVVTFLLQAFATMLTAHAADESSEPDITLMETVTVSALAFDEDANLQATPHSVLNGEDILHSGRSTLGDALSGLPGVQADTFGAGASRPIIRGQTAPRVSVVSDGSALMDASSISPDHAITTDPLLLTRVEVLRGPSALRYGGGAIGGVVNVLDGRIPTTVPEKRAQGFFALRGNTVADEKAAAASMDIRLDDNLVFHAEHAQRRAEDYEIAGFTVPRVIGSWSEGESSSIGMSWINDRGYLGMAWSWQGDTYGLPGHSHEFEDCQLAVTALACNLSSHVHTHDEAPWVDLRNRRLDIRGEYADPLPGVENVKLRVNRTRYQHDEIEEGDVSTTFLHYGYETRIEATHVSLGGWKGVVGVQVNDSEFNARGAESFIPKTATESQAIFAFEHYALNDDWHLELGARQEWQALSPIADPKGRPDNREKATSVSSAVVWRFQPEYNVSLSLARSQRLPQTQELYADGVHLATNTYECGLLACPSLGASADVHPETSHNIGVNLRKTAGDVTFDIGVYHNRIADYLYARTLDQINEFRLIRYSQIDARFVGAEGRADYHFAEGWSVGSTFDVVHAKAQGSGNNLPRIPAARFGLNMEKSWQSLSADMEVMRVFEQDRIAAYETRTPGHTLLNASLNYRLKGRDDTTFFLQGRNLLAETVWNHSSFLANRIPEPGRNISAGLRLAF